MKLTTKLMLKAGSIQRFLVVLISLLFCIYLGSSYLLSKEQTKHEIDELFDPQLAHSAFLLFDLLGESIPNIDQQSDSLPIIYHNFYGNMSRHAVQDRAQIGKQNDVDDLFIYENKFAYQVFNEQQKLLLKSSSAPNHPFAKNQQGYSQFTVGGNVWRVYSLYDKELKFWLYVAENESIRDELTQEIVEQITLPSIVIFPVFLLLLMVSVRLGLAPLKQLVASINKRDENSLEAIQLDVIPSELRPVLEANNGLIIRLQSALTREKQLTADTAHELRTPLSVVLIHAQNALNNHSELQRNSALNELEKGVKRVARLLEQLLTLSKINPEMIPKTVLNLHHLTQSVMAEMAVKIMEKNQELILDCAAEVQSCTLLGSDFLLEILIRNLLDNASQYTPEAGQIKLTISKQNSELQLVVEDSGIGIDSKLYDRLTQRFYRQHQQQGKGAGLGLTLVRDIVEFHQGKLTFDTSDLGGLLVKVSLPD